MKPETEVIHRQEATAAQRDNPQLTFRPISEGMEYRLHKFLPVLDHGFIRPVDYMGNDTAIVQAARVSYGKGTKQVQDDKTLIDYLMRQRHSTPFEMCELKLHVKLPIFVARQWIRHRTASVNEMSARYSILDREFYIPEADHVSAQSTLNRQGRGEALADQDAALVQSYIQDHSDASYDLYETLLNEDDDGDPKLSAHCNVSREISRMVLPPNIYTQWYWKVNLHNLFHFLNLRADPHAQLEIRLYAQEICKLVKAWVPHAYAAFEEYRLDAVTFSKSGAEALKRMLDGEDLAHAMDGMPKREHIDMLRWLDRTAD